MHADQRVAEGFPGEIEQPDDVERRNARRGLVHLRPVDPGPVAQALGVRAEALEGNQQIRYLDASYRRHAALPI
jgi:hypothetical protein